MDVLSTPELLVNTGMRLSHHASQLLTKCTGVLKTSIVSALLDELQRKHASPLDI